MSDRKALSNKKKSLTRKQLAFVNFYLGKGHFNATEAVIMAGYRVANRQRASEIGHQLLQKTPVLEAIKRRLTEAAMSADENLMHIAEIARGAVPAASFFLVEDEVETNELGNHESDSGTSDSEGEEVIRRRISLDWDKLREYGRLVKSISFTANGPKVELYNRLDALTLIAKHHKLLTDRVEVTDWRDTLPSNLNARKVQEQFIELMALAAQKATDSDDSG